jgi:hypothetical protein
VSVYFLKAFFCPLLSVPAAHDSVGEGMERLVQAGVPGSWLPCRIYRMPDAPCQLRIHWQFSLQVGRVWRRFTVKREKTYLE